MKRIVLLLFIVVAFSANAQYNQSINQPNNNQSFDRKFYFGIGGGLGLGTDSYGDSYNYYSILPLVGYRITDQFSLGVSLTYQRYNYTSPISQSWTQYGGGPFARYSFKSFFIQSEYDIINAANPYASENVRTNYSRWLWGIGYNFTQGSKVSLVGTVMYDVLYRVPSVFNSPIVTRVYLTF